VEIGMTNHNVKNHSCNVRLSALAAVVLAGATLTACHGNDVVHGQIDAIDMREGTLAGGELQSVNGTYGAGCTDRTGSWSLEVEVGAMLDNPELSVVLNDDGCQLTLTELRTDLGLFAASPSMLLTAAYKASPSEFDDPVSFYANAKLSSVSFAADFTLSVLYSDDPSNALDDANAEFEVVESSVAPESVDSPNYTIDPDSLILLVDSDQVVESASGNVGLTAGMVTGQTYVVTESIGLDTYAEIDAAYIAGTPAAIGANIPASAFDLVGEDLDAAAVKRTLIFANIEEGVAAYQAFEITFHAAT
jgi:hypothetical protein